MPSAERVAQYSCASSFILHPSSFILHPSSFILHPSSFRKKQRRRSEQSPVRQCPKRRRVGPQSTFCFLRTIWSLQALVGGRRSTSDPTRGERPAGLRPS